MAIADNLVAYYKFDDNSYTDSLGNFDLTNSNTTDTTGKIDDARAFSEASTQYLYRNSTTDLNPNNGSYSYNCWIYVAALADFAAYHTVFNKGGIDGTTGLECITDADATKGRIAFGKPGGWVRLTTTYDWTTGEWQMLTFTWDGTTSKIYRNGTLITGGTSNSGAYADTTHNFEIGKNYQGTANSRKYWNGKIDEFGYWTKALTQEEITSLYNSGNGLAYPFSTGWSKKIFGLSNISKINGISLSSISKVNGV